MGAIALAAEFRLQRGDGGLYPIDRTRRRIGSSIEETLGRDLGRRAGKHRSHLRDPRQFRPGGRTELRATRRPREPGRSSTACPRRSCRPGAAVRQLERHHTGHAGAACYSGPVEPPGFAAANAAPVEALRLQPGVRGPDPGARPPRRGLLDGGGRPQRGPDRTATVGSPRLAAGGPGHVGRHPIAVGPVPELHPVRDLPGHARTAPVGSMGVGEHCWRRRSCGVVPPTRRGRSARGSATCSPRSSKPTRPACGTPSAAHVASECTTSTSNASSAAWPRTYRARRSATCWFHRIQTNDFASYGGDYLCTAAWAAWAASQTLHYGDGCTICQSGGPSPD